MITTKVVRTLNTMYKIKPMLKSYNVYGFAEKIGVTKIVPENSSNGVPTYFWTAENVKKLIEILKKEGTIQYNLDILPEINENE